MSTPPGHDIDRDEVLRALALLLDPKRPHELRALPNGKSRFVLADRPDAAIKACRELHRLPRNRGVYFTLNPLAGDFAPGCRSSAGDRDVTRRRWLLIDVDPVKAEGQQDQSATDAEHEQALATAAEVAEHLTGLGWPEPIRIDSGNGGHLLYRVDLPSNSKSKTLASGVLHTLHIRWPAVDTGVFNASRVSRLPGTWARKGADTAERPHRLCRILSAPEKPEAVPVELLQALADQAAQKVRASQKPEQASPATITASVDPWTMEVREATADGGMSAWLAKALEDEAAEVAAAAPGTRNTTLNRAAFKVGQLLPLGLDRVEAVRALMEAALSTGLDYDEAQRHTLRGLDQGEENPRQAPILREQARGEQRSHATAKPAPSGPREAAPQESNGLRLDARKAGSYQIRPVKYLANPRLPRGLVVLLAGLGGEGKSTLVENVAADLSQNRPTLGAAEPFGEPIDVLILAGEDGREDSLIPRLIAAGADLDRIEIIEGLVDDNGKRVPFDIHYLPYLRRHIEEGAARGQNYKLVIIDPLATYVGRAKIDDHRDAQLKPALEELARIAQELDITFLCLAHLNKGGNAKSNASMRVMGGAAYVTSSRLAYIYGTDPEDPERRILASPKANVPGGKPTALAVRIRSLEPAEASRLLGPHVQHLDPEDVRALSSQLYRLSYDGEVKSTAEDILEPGDKPKQPASHIDAAADWLSERLANGPVCSTVVAMEGAAVAGRTWPSRGAKDRDIKILTEIKWWRERVLKARLGGGSKKFGMDGGWFFMLENSPWPPSHEAIKASLDARSSGYDPAASPKKTPEHNVPSSDSSSPSSPSRLNVFFEEDEGDEEDMSSSKKTKKTAVDPWEMIAKGSDLTLPVGATAGGWGDV